MLKIETKTSPESTPSVSPPIRTDESSNEDKLSLLVKAAEKLVNDEKSSNQSERLDTNNCTKLNAFVNSIKEKKSGQEFPVFIGKNGKPTRPFKAYPKESLSLPIGGQSTSFTIPKQSEAKSNNPTVPLTVNTNLSGSLSSSSSSSSSCSNSPVTVLNSNNSIENKNMLTTESLISLLSTLIANQTGQGLNIQSLLSENKLANLSSQLKQSDLTSLNLNDLTSFDISSLAFTPNDFCVQHRKRIQQAQERLLRKQQTNSSDLISSSTTGASPRRRNSSNGSKKRTSENSRSASLEPQINNDNQVDSTCNQISDNLIDEYMNYPPKKRHRIQQEQIRKNEQKNSDDEPSSSNSSQIENKPETPVNSPTSTTKSKDSNVNNSTRSRQSSADDAEKDDAYRERRRKNNEAAKRSRDARRAKEDDIALRAALLERENLQLKVEIAQLKQETSRLRCLLYNS